MSLRTGHTVVRFRVEQGKVPRVSLISRVYCFISIIKVTGYDQGVLYKGSIQ